MNFMLTEAALESCRGFSPRQVCVFVMSDRSHSALVTEVHISGDIAKRHARIYGTITRYGRLVGSIEEGTFHAETM